MIIIKLYFMLSIILFFGTMLINILFTNEVLLQDLEEMKEENSTFHNIIVLLLAAIMIFFTILPSAIATLLKRFR